MFACNSSFPFKCKEKEKGSSFEHHLLSSPFDTCALQLQAPVLADVAFDETCVELKPINGQINGNHLAVTGK